MTQSDAALSASRPQSYPIAPAWLAASPFVLISAAFCAGIALTVTFAPHPWLLALLPAAGALGLAYAIVRRAQALGWGYTALLLIGLGMLRAQMAAPYPGPNSAARFAGQQVLLEGVVVEEPLDRQGIAVLRVRPTRLVGRGMGEGDAADIDDSVLLRIADSGGQWRYGDVLQVDGELTLPPRIEAFDYRMYLARQGVFVWMPRAENAQRVGRAEPSWAWARLLDAKDAVRQAIRAVVPAPESALLNGILIGDDDALPERVVEAFRRTGTSHIISISGFNVGVIVGMVLVLVRRVTHPRRVAPALLAILWMYAAFVGGSASVVRAVAMTSLALLGQLLWQRGFTLNTLCAAAFFMLAARPFYLYDIGFQLSFGATLGLVLIADPLNGVANAALAVPKLHLPARLPSLLGKLGGALREGVLLTLAAQVTTLPLLLVYYEQISLITLLTNALVLPLQPPIMGLGIVTSLAGIASRELGSLVAMPVFALLRASIWTVERTAALSWAALPLGRFGLLWAAMYYGVLLAVLIGRAQPPARRALLWRWVHPRARPLAIAGGAVAAVALGISVAWSRPPPGVTSVWLTGSSALIQTPAGAQLLLVGEGDATGLAAQHLPWWDSNLDMLIVPRLDARVQEQAQTVLRTYRAAQVLVPRPAVLTDTVYLFWTEAPPTGVGEVRVAAEGEALHAEPGITATVTLLANDRLRNAVLGLRLRIGAQRVDLLPAGELSQTALRDNNDATGQPADLMFVRPTGMNQALLADWPARWLIWSNDARAPAGQTHPSRHEISLFDTIEAGFSISAERLLILP